MDLSIIYLVLQIGCFILFSKGFLLLGRITNTHQHTLKRNQKGTPELIDWGIYGKSRHPMYGSFILLQNGVFLSFLSLWSLGLAALFTIIQTANGLVEEKFVLMKKVPKKYQKYRSQVGRLYLPVTIWLLIVGLYILHGIYIFI